MIGKFYIIKTGNQEILSGEKCTTLMILPNNDHLEGDTKESQETQRIWLTAEFSKTEQDTVKVKQAMANTYCPQRLKINNVGKEHVTVKQILDQRPYPQRSEYLQSYFTSLMGFNLVD